MKASHEHIKGVIEKTENEGEQPQPPALTIETTTKLVFSKPIELPGPFVKGTKGLIGNSMLAIIQAAQNKVAKDREKKCLAERDDGDPFQDGTSLYTVGELDEILDKFECKKSSTMRRYLIIEMLRFIAQKNFAARLARTLANAAAGADRTSNLNEALKRFGLGDDANGKGKA